MRRIAILVLALACNAPAANDRDGFVIATLAEDNYVWAQRDPQLVAMKLAKMQRSPYEWLRGTANVFWRDLASVGAERSPTAFGDPAASRVLLVGDPHPENLGTFRAPDGTMFLDWNDLDSAGYGPFEGDLRRLVAGMIVAGGDPSLGERLARRVATGYAVQIRELATGIEPAPITGGTPSIDKTIAKARANGDADKDLADYAPDGTLSYGDLDPVGADGVIENRVIPLGPTEAEGVTRALAPVLARHPELGAIVNLGRRVGSGVSSYPALRYYVLVSSHRILEAKEERDGLVIAGVPQLESAEWSSPASRAVDAQRRLAARPDGDAVLDATELAPLSLKIRDHAAYQRGVNQSDLAATVADPTKRDEIYALGELFGRMLARAHGVALTGDRVPGWAVIAPVIGDGMAFVDEVTALGVTDAAQIESDYDAMKDRDLASLVLPLVRD